MNLKNPWVWTELTGSLKPDRKAGDTVPIGYLSKGATEYFPYQSWITKGYVKKCPNFEFENSISEVEDEIYVQS